jgi:hypothetical protein
VPESVDRNTCGPATLAVKELVGAAESSVLISARVRLHCTCPAAFTALSDVAFWSTAMGGKGCGVSAAVGVSVACACAVALTPGGGVWDVDEPHPASATSAASIANLGVVTIELPEPEPGPSFAVSLPSREG